MRYSERDSKRNSKRGSIRESRRDSDRNFDLGSKRNSNRNFNRGSKRDSNRESNRGSDRNSKRNSKRNSNKDSKRNSNRDSIQYSVLESVIARFGPRPLTPSLDPLNPRLLDPYSPRLTPSPNRPILTSDVNRAAAGLDASWRIREVPWIASEKTGMPLSDHSAAGANAGFSYQFERALYWLAKSASGSAVGVETDDDVTVRGADGTRVQEQDKHSISKAKPFGDRSEGLWKTLAIWIEALDAGEVSAGTTKFLMVTNKVVPECIAHKISRAGGEDEAKACVAILEASAKRVPRHVAKYAARVLRPGSRPNLVKLIQSCGLADGSLETSGPELRAKTIAELPLPEWYKADADSIVNELLGWLHDTALAAWRQRRPAWIPRDHFVNQLHAILDLRKRLTRRERAERLIPVTEDSVGKTRGSPFVKQLHLVTDDDELVDTAIREFIRCNIEKSRLSIEGNITDDDWLTFEAELLSRWRKIRSRFMRMKKAEPEEDVGFEILTETTDEYRGRLAGSETEQVYLTSGTYHRLSDMVKVGWHPRFEELMRKLLEVP
ncbi:MAG: hypothetical protein NTX53_19610 [candidate division WOR-3 bacterium]|nr:hypothetical protein [candidate division WOR-3 bacterium]